MNDDFLYKRQESPAPEFVAELREKLHQEEEPQKAKRKNGQRYINWKAIAAVFVFFFVTTGIFIYTPEIHIPVTNFVLGYPNEDVLLNAQETLGFELPDMPNGYYLASIRSTDLDFPHVITHWSTYRRECHISFSALYNPISPEALAWEEEYMVYLAERSDWLDIIPLNEKTNAIWRLSRVYNQPPTVELEWRTADVGYRLESAEDCVTQDIFRTIAQSTLPHNP